jgi:hypothetical protein
MVMRGERGQAATETMLVMLFVMLMIFGFVHMSMIATTKHIVNFAAYSASRAEYVTSGNASSAASGALLYLNWRGPVVPYVPVMGPILIPGPSRTNLNVRGRSREGYRVEYRLPFGLPQRNNQTLFGQGVSIRSFAPYGGDRNRQVQERGDNR